MTDDYAIEGEDGGYVPCLELPAQLVVEEEGAISGLATGFVAAEAQASALPATERAAIVGSGVGFVAKPCEEECVDGRQVYVVDTFGRPEIASWGTAQGTYTDLTPAGLWVKDPVQEDLGPSSESVDGDYGLVEYLGPPFAPGANASITDMILPLPSSWFSGKAWVECRWQVKPIVGQGTWYLYDVPNQRAIWFGPSTLGVAPGTLLYGRKQSAADVFQVSQTAQSVVNFVGIPFWGAVRLEAGVLKFKGWLDGDLEPADWEINPLSGVALQVPEITHAILRSGQGFEALSAVASQTGYIEVTVPC